MRRAARTDANHKAIVDAFVACGASVLQLHQVGKGCPDLCIGWRGRNLLVEIKDGAKSPSKRKLTAEQSEFHAGWRGDKVHVVDTVNAAIVLLQAFNKPEGRHSTP